MIALPPIMFLSADKRIINVFYHVTEDSDWIGSDLSKKNFLVACLIDVDLNKQQVTFFLFSGRLRKNHTALSLIFSLSP